MTSSEYIYAFFHIPKTAGSTFNHHLTQNFAPDQILAFSVRGQYYNVHNQQYEHFNSREEMIMYLESLSRAQRNRIKVIYGHSVFCGIAAYFDKPVRYITFMRETVARTISRYNYCFAFTRDIEQMPSWHCSPAFRAYWGSIREQFHPPRGSIRFPEWLDSLTYYDTLQYLFVREQYIPAGPMSQSVAKELFAQFYFVGLTERFTDDSLFIYSLLGVRSFYGRQNISEKQHRLQSHREAATIRAKLPDDVCLYEEACRQNERFRKQHSEYARAVRYMRVRRQFYILVLQHPRRVLESLYKFSSWLKQRSRVYTWCIAHLKQWL